MKNMDQIYLFSLICAEIQRQKYEKNGFRISYYAKKKWKKI